MASGAITECVAPRPSGEPGKAAVLSGGERQADVPTPNTAETREARSCGSRAAERVPYDGREERGRSDRST